MYLEKLAVEAPLYENMKAVADANLYVPVLPRSSSKDNITEIEAMHMIKKGQVECNHHSSALSAVKIH
jgi:hypothetical protein